MTSILSTASSSEKMNLRGKENKLNTMVIQSIENC